MSVINADSNLMHDLDHSPDLKTKIDERIRFIDNQLEDIKMIDELINRIKILQTIDASKKKSAKSEPIFSKLNIFKKDRDGNGNDMFCSDTVIFSFKRSIDI